MSTALSPLAALGLLLTAFLVPALLLKVPIGFAMLLGSIVTMVAGGYPILQLASVCYTKLDGFILLAMAFFIFSGSLMLYSGISRSLIEWFDSLVGRFRGNLGMVCVLTSAAFGALTGTVMSTLSAVGSIMIPEMVAKGYPRAKAASIVAAAAFLGIMIPPSNPGLMYAMAAEANILDVWMSTVGPGLLLIILYCVYNYLDRRRVEPSPEEPFVPAKFVANFATKTRLAFFALLMPVIIFGGIYGGIFTPTEAGAVACGYGLVFFLSKKYITKRPMPSNKNLMTICTESGAMVGRIAMILVFSAALGRVVAMTGASRQLATIITDNITQPYIFLILINVLFLILGTFMELNSAVLIMTPLLLPSAKAMGIDPIHFGAIALVNMSVGTLTPPLGLSLSIGAKMAEVPFTHAVKECLPYMGIGLIVIAITSFCPDFVLFFPAIFH